jgi:hypothetical protein
VSVDLTGAPSAELSLKLREFSGEITFIGQPAELAEPATLRFRKLTVGFHLSVLDPA